MDSSKRIAREIVDEAASSYIEWLSDPVPAPEGVLPHEHYARTLDGSLQDLVEVATVVSPKSWLTTMQDGLRRQGYQGRLINTGAATVPREVRRQVIARRKVFDMLERELDPTFGD